MTGVIGNVYDKYGSQNPIVRRLMAGFEGALLDLITPVQPRSILEVGCGEGYLAARLQKRLRAERFVACDLEIAQCRPELNAAFHPHISPINFEVASIYDLPYESQSFDLVVCCEVLEHLEAPGRGLTELSRVAKNAVLLSTPREPLWRALNMLRGSYLRDWGNTPGHVQHFSRRALLRLCQTQLEGLQVKTPLPWTVVLGHPRR